MPFTPAHTARLSLTPFTEADVEESWRYRALDEVATWTAAYLTSLEQWRSLAMAAHVFRVAIRLSNGRLIGDASITVSDAWAQAGAVAAPVGKAQAELGWALDPAYAGRGYATEAISEIIRFCFDELGVRRVTASAFADNAASIRVMQKLGLRHEATTIADSWHATRGWTDGAWYAVLAEEWRALDMPLAPSGT